MIERSYDAKIAKESGGLLARNEGIDWQDWLSGKNIMAVSGDDVGLATYDLPGVYTLHWFFTSRGRKALDTANEMLDWFFSNHDVKVIRGLTPKSLRHASFLARRVGLKSYGMVQPKNDEPHELFIMTKEEFYGRR